jgi:hypothetical protein
VAWAVIVGVAIVLGESLDPIKLLGCAIGIGGMCPMPMWRHSAYVMCSVICVVLGTFFFSVTCVVLGTFCCGACADLITLTIAGVFLYSIIDNIFPPAKDGSK